MEQESVTISEEQKSYIEFTDLTDTKLLATAGSGKTFCIIQHVKHLVSAGIVDPEHVYMLTFSKNAKDDFQTKVKRSDASDCIPIKNICTIDSFAWRMLGPEVSKEIDVSLLSYAYLDELKTHTNDDLLAKFSVLNDIQMVFVDEAQDLNEIQYNILVRMKAICPRLTLHFIGDPNQNIYQFRKASDKYLVNFDAKTFHLTKNYRSQAHIVDFCSHLRPYNNCVISSAQPKKSLDVTFYAYENHNMFEHMVLSILHLFQAKKIPLHKCAILAPTRGYIRDTFGACRYKGLCYIANLLYQHNIPFSQFYNDVGSNAEQELSSKVNYKPKRGHLNLMTYTSSKGLEWDYVIIIDANAHLISRIDYDNDKFNAEQYLLYVACSRPRKNLIVFTKRKYANPWFKDVPVDKYKVARHCEDSFDFFDTNLLFDTQPPPAQQVSNNDIAINVKTLINRLDLEDLYAIQKLLKGKCERKNMPVQNSIDKTHKLKFPDIRYAFANQYLAHLLAVLSTGKPLPQDHVFIRDIHNIINHQNVVLCPNERVISWYYDNRSDVSWSTWDVVKSSLDAKIVTFVETHFDKAKDFNSYTLIDRFYDIYVHRHIQDIKDAYNSYCVNHGNISNVLCMTRMAYAIRSTHYFYIEQGSVFEQEFMGDHNLEFYKSFINLASNLQIKDLYSNVQSIDDHVSLSNIDLSIDLKPIFVTLQDGLNIKDTILCMIYARCMSAKYATHSQDCYTVHLLSGCLNKVSFANINDADFQNILKILKSPKKNKATK